MRHKLSTLLAVTIGFIAFGIAVIFAFLQSQ